MKRTLYKIITVTLILCTLCSCRVSISEDYVAEIQAQAQAFDFADAAERISSVTGVEMTEVFLESMGEEKAQGIIDAIDGGTYTDRTWLYVTGYSYHVINDMLSGNINAENISDFGFNGKGSFTVSFVGDILFDVGL